MTATELLTVREFCDRYRCGRTSVYREAKAGRIRLRKMGAATRIALADAEKWAASLPDYSGSNADA